MKPVAKHVKFIEHLPHPELDRILHSIESLNVKFSVALNLRGELIVASSDSIGPLTEELTQEHEQLNRAQMFAEAIHATGNRNPLPLHQARIAAEQTGGFLEHYESGKMRERLSGIGGADPHWVMARSFGSVRRNKRFMEGKGGIQIEMPTHDIPDVVHNVLPRAGDKIVDENEDRTVKICQEKIRERPSCAAVVRDIYSLIPHEGFASCARDIAFKRIMELNTGRSPEERVRFLLAAIFSIRGLKVGDRTLLLDDFSERPVQNVISFKIHANSVNYPASLGWKLVGRNVPVQIDGQSGELITDWHVLVTDLEEVSRRKMLTALMQGASPPSSTARGER